MVHLEKVQGQRGHMIIQEDGTILSSSGELSNNESVSNQITSLMKNSLNVDFNAHRGSGSDSGHNGDANSGGEGHPSGSTSNGSGDGATLKWNRITVQFDNDAYVACLSNRRIHVVKRDTEQGNGAQ